MNSSIEINDKVVKQLLKNDKKEYHELPQKSMCSYCIKLLKKLQLYQVLFLDLQQ